MSHGANCSGLEKRNKVHTIFHTTLHKVIKSHSLLQYWQFSMSCFCMVQKQVTSQDKPFLAKPWTGYFGSVNNFKKDEHNFTHKKQNNGTMDS